MAAVKGGGAGVDDRVAGVSGLHSAAVLRQPLDDALVRTGVHRTVLLPAEQHRPPGRGVPQLAAAVGAVGGHPEAVAVVHGVLVAPHHPGVLAPAAPRPLVLVLVVDDRQPAPAVGDVEDALADVQPEDVDVGCDVIGGERQLRGQVVDRAVVTARVDPEVVRHQALDALGQLIAGQYLAVVAEGEDIAVLVAHPAAVLGDMDPERRGARTEAPQHRRDRRRRGRRRSDLTVRHRPGGTLPLDGRSIALAHLLTDLPGGRGLRLLPRRKGRRLPLSGRADPPVPNRDDGVRYRHLVELVGTAAVLGQFQIGRDVGRGLRHGLGHGELPSPGRSQRPFPRC